MDDTPRYWFRQGVKDVTPILVGMLPFALIAGSTASTVGLPFWAAFTMSWWIFAGASQLAMLDLFHRGAPLMVLILTALIINVRMIIYSGAVAPYLKDTSNRWKPFFAYFLTDQAYLVSVVRRDRNEKQFQFKWFYLGAGVACWLTWQVGTLTGILLGATAPESWNLDFAVPLSFVALLAGTIKGNSTICAALAAGAGVFLGKGLPMNLGLIVGILCGIAAGVMVERRTA